jgi:colanic acid biosynthesis glycosyl transferase WcaI
MNRKPLKILITTQVFLPEPHPTGVMVQELAIGLAQRGHKVTVAAGLPHHPYGVVYPGYGKHLLEVENQNGFRIVRGWQLVHPSSAFISRSLVMGTQCAAFCLDALSSPRSDIIISFGPPLMGPLTSAVIARLQGAKLINVIYDIVLDIALGLDLLKNHRVINLAKKIESLTFQLSDKIVVLSEGFRHTLINEKKVDSQKIVIIPVWLDARDVTPLDRNNLWRQELQISAEKFVVLYSGTIGLVSGAEVILDAAQQLASYPDILFLIVGAGQTKEKMEAKARQAGLKNIRFLPLQPRERLSELQSTADVSLVTLAPTRGKTSVPSKVLGYMAASRPVIASVDLWCDTAAMIQKAECGRVVPPANGKELSEAILYYYHNPIERKADGEKGRQFFLANLERSVIVRKYINLIGNLDPR